MIDASASRRPHRRALLWFWIAAVALLAAGLGMRESWPPDEPRFALVARDMVRSGDWLFPRRNGELYADKPPLHMWAIALSYLATGSIRVAAVLPSLLAALGTLWLVVDLGRRLWSPRVGIAAGWGLLLSAQFAWQAHVGQIDAHLCWWTTLALYGLLRHLLLGPAWGWYALAWAAMGFGVITKGVGFLPALVLLPWLVLRLRAQPGLPSLAARDVRWWLSPPLLLAAAACWAVPMLLAVHASGDPALAAYRDEILFRQTATRYVKAWHHHEGPHYYIVQAAVLWLPGTLLLPWLVPAWWRRVFGGPADSPRRRCDPRTALLLGWAFLVLLFFSASPGKRGVYILPALPALALAAAPLLPGLLRRRDVRGVATAVGWALAAALLAAGVAAFAIPERLIEAADAPGLDPGPLAIVALAAAALAALWMATWRRRAHVGVAGLAVLLWSLFGWIAVPLIDRQASLGTFLGSLQAELGDDARLGIVRFREQYALAAPSGITSFGYRRSNAEQLELGLAWLSAEPRRFLLIPTRLLPAAGARLDPARLRDLGCRRGDCWTLAGADALRDAR